MSAAITAMAVMNGYNQVQQGRYAKAMGGLQAQQNAYQAQVENENALKTAEIIRRAGKRQVGQATTAYAAAGVKVGEGSAAEVEDQINKNVEHDAFQAILEGGRRARGLQTEGSMALAQGRMAEAAGTVNAVGTVMGGAYSGMRSGGWRTAGPGFAGTQAPAPIVDRSVYLKG